jgi:hypothetical protein
MGKSPYVNTPVLGYLKDRPKTQPIYMHGFTGMAIYGIPITLLNIGIPFLKIWQLKNQPRNRIPQFWGIKKIG